ncbi:protein argonaute-2-like isoform X3 [Coccinella septempunctata]|uniref:protein argonaute-2-like isoform X3 n=1 Tax=Coccinella septempunctata TaxID=41139 RepID=UPI001D09861E|nr:protein argonaute-2-like isoform X3 [Coccinella septempunctata]
MARKKKGQKPDPQAGGDASANPPEPSGSSTSQAPQQPPQQGPAPQQHPPQGRPQEAHSQQQQGQGAWQKAGQQQQKGPGAWQKGGQPQKTFEQQRPGPQPHQQQGQGPRQSGGQPQQPFEQPRTSPSGPHPQQGRGARQRGGQPQQTFEQPRTSPSGPQPQQQQGQGPWQRGGPPQQQGQGPQQRGGPPQQQGQGPQQRGGPQQQQGQGPQQRGGPQQQQGQGPQQRGGPPQQQGQGAWQTGGQPQQTFEQPRTSPPGPHPQQEQGAWQRRGPPQQQGQGPQQRGGPPQQQGQGAWQTGGQPQQTFEQPRTSPPGPHPQQEQGAWQRRGPPQQQGQGPQQRGGPPQQQGQGPQQRGGPPQQQGQGPWQKGQQQVQGAWQTGGQPPQGQGAWQRAGQPQQTFEQPRTTPPGPQQGQGPQQRGQQQQQQGRHQQPHGQQRTSQQDTRSHQQQGAIPKSQSVVQYGSDPIPEIQKLSTVGRGGTKGRRILVETNYLSMDFGKLPKAYHYDVQITPDTPKRWLRDVFEQFRRKHFPKSHPAFDGKRNMYSPYELIKGNVALSDKIELEIPNEDKKKSYEVSVQFAAEVDLSPLRNMAIQTCQQAMQCVEIVLRSAPSMRCIQAGRSFYTPPPQIIRLGEGMEMYFGFYQTVVRGWKPFFNVDVAHKAFPSQLNIIDLIAEIGSDFRTTIRPEDLKRDTISRDLETKLLKHLRTLRITYQIPGMKREYRVNGLGDPPRYSKFSVDNVTMTIEEYFLKKKGIRLNYPLMPSLWVGSPQRADKILLPAEFCTVVANQAVPRKMSENQTSAMIKHAATPTTERKRKIMDGLKNTRHNEDPCIREFGFRINNDFEKIEARVLDPPALEYSNGMIARPSRGVWRQDNNKFYIGGEESTWIVISVCGNMAKECDNLARMISGQAAKCGMRLAPKPGPYDGLQSRQPSARDVLNILQKYSQNYNLIFVVIPDGGPAYSHVKKAAEITLNCLTQCIKRRTLMKMNPATVGNILLKVNSKLSGTNHCLNSKPPILLEPCMIMGADVTHPSPDSKGIPSVVAVTASHDPKAMYGYNMCCRLQLPTLEIIEDLEAITIEHLKYFFQRNRGQKPYRIIFFRDGVSEGQFAEVRQKELSAIRRACSKIEDGYEPKITFIVVQKRHHTRFFPTNRNDSEDRNLNVPAGTCVDTVITSLNQQDFYLVSHASIQGVAKPTKYSTLWDDNDMSYDDVEQLAYYLCHLFSRCNRSVSYPAPTYYAHLGAARAKVYIESEQININNLQNEQRKLKNDRIRKEKPMFFV